MLRCIRILFFAIMAWAVASMSMATPDSDDPKLTLDLQGVSLPMLLNMIAAQHDLNIVISGDVSGEVSLRLNNVDLATGLEAILGPMGYNYYIKDDVIVVKAYDTFAAGELAAELVTLKYLTPATAQKALEPLLSDKGKTVVLDKGTETGSKYSPNRILLVDFPAVVKEMKAVLADLDQPERMVSIQVRIIETKVDSKSHLGFSWPTSFSAVLGQETNTTGTSTQESPTGGLTGAATHDLNTGNFTWATLNVAQVKLALDLLNEDGNSRLVSDPRLTTLENHEAVIKIQTIIPIPTVSRFTEGAATADIVTFQDEEVGISLTVTPRINEDGRITLEVHPVIEDIIGYTGPADSQKPITTSRSIKTTITVNDGETAVLGGLLKEDEIERIHRVPLLGHIPFLGKLLFTRTSRETTTTDLIVMITPHVQ